MIARVAFVILILTGLTQAMPVAAALGISTSETAPLALMSTNSTLGSTIPVGPMFDFELKSSTQDLPDGFVNASELFTALVETSAVNTSAMAERMTYYLDLTQGEYLPDVSVARATKNMWIDNPYSSETACDLTFIMSNPDETLGRYFRVYMNGTVLYNEVHNTERLAETIRITVLDGFHQFTFEVQHGAYGKGWALELAQLWTLNQHDNLYLSADLAEDELFPLAYIATIDKYVCNIDGYEPILHLAVQSSNPYSRWLYVRVDDQEIYARVIYSSWEVNIDVSSLMSPTDIHKVTVIVKSGAYRQWTLVYLGVERSVAKYAPYTLNLGISMSWTPTAEYISDFTEGLRSFVQMLWAASEEQLLVLRIDIYFNEVLDRNNYFTWPAHTNVYVDENYYGSPYAWGGSHRFVLPYQWFPPWQSYMAYHAITHEFAHAFFSVGDEYIVNQPVDCGPLWWSGYCIMEIVQSAIWPRPEICVRANHDPDKDTPQELDNHESCWETIKRSYPLMYEPYRTYAPLAGLVAGLYCTIVHP